MPFLESFRPLLTCYPPESLSQTSPLKESAYFLEYLLMTEMTYRVMCIFFSSYCLIRKFCMGKDII